MPFVNPQAEFSVVNVDVTTILQGCAVVSNGTFTPLTLTNVTHTTGLDSWILGVTQADLLANAAGTIYQSPFSNVQVRLASNVSKNDKLQVANTIGEFQTATANAINVMYIALTDGLAGTNTTWAVPISNYNTFVNSLVQTQYVSIAADTTTTSNIFVDLLTKTMTTSAGTSLLIRLSASASSSTLVNAVTSFRITVDGVSKGGCAQTVTLLNGVNCATHTVKVTGLAAGNHTIKAQWRTSGATAQIRPVGAADYESASLLIEEVTV